MTVSLDSRSRTTPSGPEAPRSPGRRRNRYDGLAPWLFVAPTVLGIGAFYVWPTAQSVYFSFTKWGAFGGVSWIGTANYTRLFSDPDLLVALGNTVLYAAVALAGIPLAIWLASLLNRPGLRFRSFFRVLFFLPVVTVPAAVSTVWKLLYNGDYGMINYVLSLVGIKGPYWLQTPVVAVVAVGIVGVWMSLGFNMIILGAGLQAISPEVYEAAELDGAGPFRQLVHITIPLLTPSIFFLTVMTAIGAFKVFDLIFLMIGNTSPVIKQTQTLVFFFYSKGFMVNDKGYAAAIGVVLLLIIALVTYGQFRLQRKWVHYE
ncbi:multiple sugar transport system permease protein [Kribbella aluminosa]|uniref:Multiple sugar transport system permease protein n=1 Tax=Kribbella aluminosa TaxID=416017 RepID=A0ABS4UWL4_9ACTN|nr:sugar ABC transporter permease [Kribbella aluminosa]MBP2356039.1 multiple sugar transport system permease protein [Kribbella aluminosa]